LEDLVAFEVDFLPIGEGTKSGDSICIRYYTHPLVSYVYVVDGGYLSSFETVRNHIDTYYQCGGFM